ncbi:MAG: hypothetical protein AUF79_15350 [Crenarchaeota archaeon 13_1_20CM_2_51_8]|nr:MAG: hypothetical protein AUF79_15350 [Crenarchaeota archaeon 13_1_20CM_2_51_8]
MNSVGQTQHGEEYDTEALSRQFKSFGEKVYHGSSPLYEQISRRVSEDPELLSLVLRARKSELSPNLFFGAIHYLLLRGLRHQLSSFYPSLSGSTIKEDDPYPFFRSFCLENRKEIEDLISTRRVQTNEVQRCTCLMPAYAVAYRRAGKPLSIVDLGASAGLHLLWDHFGYDYGEGKKFGDPSSPVQLACLLHGNVSPPFPSRLPLVAYRVGIDLNPIDVNDPKMMLWLKALVWPEHLKRAETLNSAIELAKQIPPAVIRGDVLAVLPEVLSKVPVETAVCISHSHLVYQFPKELRERFFSMINECGAHRDIFQISYEWWPGKDKSELELSIFENGAKQEQLLAYCNPHGEWLQWVSQE